MMLEILNYLLWAISVAALLVGLICLFWFCYALVVTFWKINIKKKPIQKCYHSSMNYNSELNHWKCNDCDEVFKD